MAKNRISHLGERGFLARLLPSLRNTQAGKFIVPPGDDAAVLATPSRSILSIDGLTEGTHFLFSWREKCERTFKIPFGRALGWKLMGSSLSDLASMGANRRRWALIYLGAPAWLDQQFLVDFYRGVKETAEKYSCVVAGGDTVRARELTLVAAVGAEAVPRKPLLIRSGAKVGDLICMTGAIGDAGVGLKILMKKKTKVPLPDHRYFVRRFFQANPLFDAGALLASTSGVSACMDLSDSLAECLSLFLESSQAGAVVEVASVQTSPIFRRYYSPAQAADVSGEDYALLFAASRSAVKTLLKKIPLSVLGTVVRSAEGVRWFNDGVLTSPPATFRHYSHR